MADESNPERHWDFQREEFIALRSEIARHDSHRARLQYATVFGSVLITWGIIRVDTTSYPEAMLALLSAAPLVVLFSGWLISRSHDARAEEAAAYIRELERVYARQGRGWEAWLAEVDAGADARDFHLRPPEAPRPDAARPEAATINPPRPAAPGPRRRASAAPTNVLFIGMGMIEAGVLGLNLVHAHPTIHVPEWRREGDATTPGAPGIGR